MKNIFYYTKKPTNLFALIGYVIIVLFVFAPVLFPNKGQLIFGDDIHRSYHFFRIYQRHQFQQGVIPWWNPFQFNGEPFIANPSVTFWYPPNWLYIFLDYRFVFSWLVPAHIVLGMMGMYWLCRGHMSRLAAWSSGIAFGLSGFFMGRLWEGHIDILMSAPYIPIVFGCLWRALEKNTAKRIVLAGSIYALQIFAGYQTIAYFTGWSMVVLVVLWSLREKSLRPYFVLGAIILIAGGLAALQIVPSQEFFKHSIRNYDMPYSWVVIGSYTLQNLAQLVAPFLLGEPGAYKGPGPNYGELAAYIGIIPLLLSVSLLIFYGVSKFRHVKNYIVDKELLVLSSVVIGIFGLWVSFGWNAAIDLQHILWKSIPLYQYLRIPSRHLILFVFSLSILSGFGLDIVKKKSLRLIIVCCIVVDLMLFAKHFVVLKPDPDTRHNPQLVSYLQQNSGLSRVLPNFNVGMGTRDAFDFDAAMAYQVYSATGYDPAILRNYYDFIVAANGVKNYDVQQSDVQVPYLNPSSRYVDFLNIKYFFVPTWFDGVGEVGGKYRMVLEETKKDFWRLYENTNVVERFFVVPNIVVASKNDVSEAIIAHRYDPLETVLTNDTKLKKRTSSDCRGSTKGTVSVVRYGANEITLQVNTPCHMYLTGSDVYYPGWTALVDNVPAHIFEANLAFRGIEIPQGNHTVVFRYNPVIFVVGASISLVTAGVCLVWLAIRKNR